MNEQPSINQKHALVMGGGIAGLLAARVLSDHFGQITIIERDEAPGTPSFRPGTPQAWHRHGISNEGKRIFETLFPGLDTALAAANSPLVRAPLHDRRFGADYAIYRGTDFDAPPSAAPTLGTRIVSRIRLEWEVLQRVAQLPNVRFVRQAQVMGMVTEGDWVRGAQVRHLTSRRSELMAADLLVDASGRQSKVMGWLAAAGYDLPPETVVDPQVMMATCWYKIPPHHTAEWEGLMIEARHPHNPRSAIVTRIEGAYYLLTLSGKAGFYPPTKAAEIVDYLGQLRRPGIYNLLKDLQPMATPRGYANTANRRRHFEKLTRFPHNLIVMGDAACGFNPSHGYGMGEACQGAMALAETLHSQADADLTGFGLRYHRATAVKVDPTWQQVVKLDQHDLKVLGDSYAPTVTALPLVDEPHVSAWLGYADDGQREGAFFTLKSRFPQLQFPIRAGIHESAAYRVATLMGHPVVPEEGEAFALQRPSQLQVQVVDSVWGRVPLLTAATHQDFVRLVQALGKRNQPVSVPAATDIYTIVGLTNWDRIRAYKTAFFHEQSLDPAGLEAAWQQKFRQLIPHKALYQDRFVIAYDRLSQCAPPPGETAVSWPATTANLLAERAALYYHLPHLLGPQRETALHVELLTYYAAMVQTIGTFRADWFMALVNPLLLRDTSSHELLFDDNQTEIKTIVRRRQDWLRHAAQVVEQFDRDYGRYHPTPLELLAMLKAIDSLSLEDLTFEQAPPQLALALTRFQPSAAKAVPDLVHV